MIRVLLAAILLGAGTGTAVQPRVDFSGEWVSRGPSGYALLRFVPRTVPRGPEAVSGAPTLSIRHLGDRIVVAFPGDRRNYLTRPPFVIDDTEHEVVEHRGDYWTKYVMRAAWAGDSLVLRARSFAGWWKIQSPDAVRTTRWPFESRLELSLDDRRETLTVNATIADEKFEAEYRQLYSRGPQP